MGKIGVLKSIGDIENMLIGELKKLKESENFPIEIDSKRKRYPLQCEDLRNPKGKYPEVDRFFIWKRTHEEPILVLLEFEFVSGSPVWNILKIARYLQLNKKFMYGGRTLERVKFFHFIGCYKRQNSAKELEVKEKLVEKISEEGRSKYEAQILSLCVSVLEKIKEKEKANLEYTCFVMRYPNHFKSLGPDQKKDLARKLREAILEKLEKAG